ncbi:MAG: hypothetical protein A2806_00380 [Candidatus Terrybacteria bacterium RIFCSPHIGHO2_01_FULL_48_17]|uniref:Haloacid dehalogenase n=1 Tax=Candidatus Terrybacteria bacterium RIFCSPHIGHO2_01_FULL_48_17 TaxID=1802362 RepID=A0A1G2PLW0_9BACT|nr:MAG: hypothetical protein A2806_00380 [Candidatus Terrybacteria bacterium RIFCSPHIGHO2_01_FULL_48_17]
MKPAVLVFDADDTLWMNEWQYSKAFSEFYAYLYQTFGPYMPNFRALQTRFEEIDRMLFPVWGVRRGRVSEAMLETYHELRDYFKRGVSAGKRFPKADVVLWSPESAEKQTGIEARIAQIGDRPFQYKHLRWLRFAQITLDELKQRGHTLCVLTSYDGTVWPKKAVYLEAMDYFHHSLAIPAKKTAEDFIKVSGWGSHEPGTKFYAIGNGESDITPALEISDDWHGIYLPHGSTSAYFINEKSDDPYMPPSMNHPRVLTLDSIRQLRLINFDAFHYCEEKGVKGGFCRTCHH